MNYRNQSGTKALNFGRRESEVSIGEYSSLIIESMSRRSTKNNTSESEDQGSGKSDLARSHWFGDIMWTFAFGEQETSRMAGSAFSSGRQAWHLLNHMHDLCKAREATILKSSALVIRLASELRAMAAESPNERFALELRVTKAPDGRLEVELMDKGRWRKPSLRVNANSENATMVVNMGS